LHLGGFLLELPPAALEVHLGLAQRMVALVEEPRLFPKEFLALVEFSLPLVEPVHEASEFILAPHDVRFPLSNLAEGPLPRLEFPPKRLDAAAQGCFSGSQLVLLHAQDVAVCVLHLDEALLELQDVLFLEEELLDLPLELLSLAHLEGVRRLGKGRDALPRTLDQGVHLLEALLPSLEHLLDGFGELP